MVRLLQMQGMLIMMYIYKMTAGKYTSIKNDSFKIKC